jgi:dephospho-CoA kinase
MPLVIALTGGIGSGKSSVAAMLKELGAAIIDTDEIAHRLTAAGQPGARVIGEQFGPGYLRADGALDRERMRELVFSDPAAKKQLEAILHPMIRAEVDSEISAPVRRAPYIVIVVPLLIETGAYRDLARRILVVDCSEEQQITRVVQRGGLAADAARAIMASQVARAERLKHADDIVHNEADLAALHADVAALHRKYLELAKNPDRSWPNPLNHRQNMK